MRGALQVGLIGVAALLAVGSADAPPRFVVTNPAFQGQNPRCQLRTAASHPGDEYTEVGYILNRQTRSAFPLSAEHLINPVYGKVCRAGGQVVALEINGLGNIVRAVVFRYTPRPRTGAPAEQCEPACSPGFRCAFGRCIPQCNPPCAADERCDRHRTCVRRLPALPAPPAPSGPPPRK